MGDLLGGRRLLALEALETPFLEPFRERSLIGNNRIFLRLKVTEQWENLGKGVPRGENEMCAVLKYH